MVEGSAQGGCAVKWIDKLPSLGFVAIVLTNAALVVFLAWGFRTPPLERVWELHHELKIGALGKLNAKDHALLSAALTRHAKLADGLLPDGQNIGLLSANSAGWLETADATILRSRRAGSSCALVLGVKIPEVALPLGIDVSGRKWQRQLKITRQGSTRLALPKARGGPEIITLQTATKDRREQVATMGLHVGFDCENTANEGGHD